MSDALVHRADDDRIAVITLDSPANRNALSRRLIAELTDHLAQAGADESLHGILLLSSHPVFCAGADLKEAATVDMVESARGIIALQRAIVAAPVPVVTRLDGPVRAGGLGLVAVGSGAIVTVLDRSLDALRRIEARFGARVITAYSDRDTLAMHLLQSDLAETSTQEVELREGLARAQFELFYQPQHDVKGRLVGAEALVR